MESISDILKLRSRTDLKVTFRQNWFNDFFRNYLYKKKGNLNNKQAVFCRVGSWPVCQSPPSCHGDVAGVCVGRAVSAHLGSAAASVPHQKEAKDGGNVQAQRRGEEADESGGARKTRAASTAAQRRTPHMIPCFETLNFRIEAPSFPHLDVIFLFCTRIRLDWTSSFDAYNMRKICIIHLPAVLLYHNKY